MTRKEWLKEYPDMRRWEVVGPFATPEEAQRWEKKQRGCEKSGGGERDFPGSRWYGYRFEY